MLTKWGHQTFGGFHSHGGTPIAGWFRMENPITVDHLGVPPFQETTISRNLESSQLSIPTMANYGWDQNQSWKPRIERAESKKEI